MIYDMVDTSRCSLDEIVMISVALVLNEMLEVKRIALKNAF